MVGLNHPPLSLIFYKNFITCTKEINLISVPCFMELIDQNIANATRMRVYVLVTASRNVFTPCHISVFDICRIIEVM